MKLVKMEHPLSHERYVVGKEIGRGNWGIVYEAVDNRTGDELAIKVFSPTDLALTQAAYRNLELEEIVRKERLSLEPMARIVPRYVDFDSTGRPFLVMKRWPTWLSGVMAERAAGRGISDDYWGIRSPLLPSGFQMHEVTKISKEIIAAISELHGTYRKAHCDIKPDNLVFDKGRILISDFGTSTYAAVGTENRDNMGHLYTRPLNLFIPGQHPDLHSDVFSAGALIYKLFTNKYPFEDELNEAMNCEGGIERFVRQFYSQGSGSWLREDRNKYHDLIDSKVLGSTIPKPFHEPIRSALSGSNSMDHIGMLFSSAEATYRNDCTNTREKQQVRDDIKFGIKAGALGGVSIATGILSLMWISYFGSPNFDSRPDFETRASRRSFNQSEITFELERPYSQPVVVLSGMGYQGMKVSFDEVKNPQSLMDRITDTWLQTIDEMKHPGEDNDFDFRYHQVFHNGLRFGRHAAEDGKMLRDNETEDGKMMAMGYASLQYKRYLQHAFKTYTLDGHLVDLEDSTMLVLVGLEKLNKAQKITNSTQYTVYNKAMYDGKLVIPENTRLVAERFWTNLARRMPQMIQYKQTPKK